MAFGHNRMQAGYKLRGVTFCASARVLLNYSAYPSLPHTSALNPALRPLRGLAHGLPYPAHFGADSHDVTCRKKIRWTAYLSAIGVRVITPNRRKGSESNGTKLGRFVSKMSGNSDD